MKVIFDEYVPDPLRRFLLSHELTSVQEFLPSQKRRGEAHSL